MLYGKGRGWVWEELGGSGEYDQSMLYEILKKPIKISNKNILPHIFKANIFYMNFSHYYHISSYEKTTFTAYIHFLWYQISFLPRYSDVHIHHSTETAFSKTDMYGASVLESPEMLVKHGSIFTTQYFMVTLNTLVLECLQTISQRIYM